jgi:SH3-like domain-containing protein
MPDGRKYVGEFQGGVRVGQGLMTFPDGTKYLGNWLHDKPDGQGKLSSAGKYEYVGEFKNGVRHGQGTLETVDGKRYEGQWENDVPHGRGKITYPDGAQFNGQFINGKRHGDGQAFYADGSSYTGQWQDDVRSGQGTMTYANGEQYTGEFSNDQRHGIGTLVTPEGSKYLVHWRDDIIIRKEEISPSEETISVRQEETTVAEISGHSPLKEKEPVAKQPEIEEQPSMAGKHKVTEMATEEPVEDEKQPAAVDMVVQEPHQDTKDKPVSVAKAGFATVQKSGVYVRSGPSSEYRIIRSVNKGYPVEIIEYQGDWAHIQDYLNSEGWIFNTLLGENNSVIVVTTKVNLRSGPGVENMIMDKLDYGTVLRVKETTGEWHKVESKSGTVGWLNNELVWPPGPLTEPGAVPEEEITPPDEVKPAEEKKTATGEISGDSQIKGKESVAKPVEGEEKPVMLEQQAVTEVTTVEPVVEEQQPVAVAVVIEEPSKDTADKPVLAAGVGFASVRKNGVYVRSGPSSEYRIIRSVNKGYPVEIIEYQGEWVHIQDYLGSEGWIFNTLLGENNSVIVATTKVNLRSGPGIENMIVDKLDYGTVLRVKETTGEWYKVESKGGTVGWLNNELVWPAGGPPTEPGAVVEEVQSTTEESLPEVESASDIEVDKSVLEQLKEQEIARQYEADATSMESLGSKQIIELTDSSAETVTEKILVVESKPVVEQGETARQQDDKATTVISGGQTLDQTTYVSITSQGKGANIRSGPSLDAEVLRAVPIGYPLLVIDQSDNWTLVEDFRQRQGWVYNRLLAANTTVVVKVGKGNLRSDPSLRDAIVAKLDYGMVMQVEERQDNWLKVKGGDSIAGWLHKEVIWP